MDPRTFKDQIYAGFTQIGKVVSSPKRIELLDLLSQSPKTVETLVKETAMSTANTSKHLHALLEAQLVRYEKEKNYVIYQLANEKVVDLLFAIKTIAEEQIEDVTRLRDEFIVRSDDLETITLEEWLNRRDTNEHVLIDVRPQEEYVNEHIDGALSIPIEALNEHISLLPMDKEVIAYCRGAYCVYATEAVERLKVLGYQAVRLEAGVHEWREHYHKQTDDFVRKR
ncbi:ArsR/SmtB family transcription factor [Alkalihalobacillus sp. CinArs1]|uniref:ArsR/SmtB family transcription factor n=1 Tax=Alkalihalobacillus sp. CinArs1 TaxID=2995314 RepID=UPI0022DD7321|nr:metalloregulator ArsR/SmtB family transcription factor [Alkalihalobacillus sp. CinArs1]